MEEFQDFQKYIDSIDELLEENGVVKVIPPAGSVCVANLCEATVLQRVSFVLLTWNA